MVKVTVVLLDEEVRKEVGAKEVSLEVPEGSTVRDLLEKIAQKYGKKIIESSLRAGALILLNGQNIELLGGLDARLSSGDRIAVIPPLDGG